MKDPYVYLGEVTEWLSLRIIIRIGNSCIYLAIAGVNQSTSQIFEYTYRKTSITAICEYSNRLGARP